MHGAAIEAAADAAADPWVNDCMAIGSSGQKMSATSSWCRVATSTPVLNRTCVHRKDTYVGIGSCGRGLGQTCGAG